MEYPLSKFLAICSIGTPERSSGSKLERAAVMPCTSCAENSNSKRYFCGPLGEGAPVTDASIRAEFNNDLALILCVIIWLTHVGLSTDPEGLDLEPAVGDLRLTGVASIFFILRWVLAHASFNLTLTPTKTACRQESRRMHTQTHLSACSFKFERSRRRGSPASMSHKKPSLPSLTAGYAPAAVRPAVKSTQGPVQQIVLNKGVGKLRV